MYFDKNRRKVIEFIVSKKEVESKEVLNFLLLANNVLHKNLLQLTRIGKKDKITLTSFKDEKIDKKRVVYFINDFLNILHELESEKYIIQTETNVEDIDDGGVILELGNRLPRQRYSQELENLILENRLAFERNNVIKATPRLIALVKNQFKTEEESRFERTRALAEQNASNSSNILKANKLNLALSILAILSALLFNYQSCNSTQKTIDTLSGIEQGTGSLNTNLNSVNEKFKEIPKSISEFSTTLGELNKTIVEQQESLKENTQKLSETVESFKSNITKFEESIGQYNNELDKIIEQTEVQLKIWEKQQELMKNEFARRTNLQIENIFFDFDKTKNMCRLRRFELHNKGNIEAELNTMLFYIDINSPVEIVQTLGGIFEIEQRNGKKKYRDSGVQNIIHPDSYVFYNPEIYFPIESIGKDELIIEVFYTSKYKSGKREFKVGLNKCK